MARILITSGPTRQYLDPVRYLSNASSGRMGAALASAAIALNHQVVIVSGPVAIDYPTKALVIPVTSTEQMLKASLEHFSDCDGVIGAAAPCDYQPIEVAPEKLQKTGAELKLSFVETPDILATLGSIKRTDQWLVGFALETENGHQRALEKIRRKSLDLIVLNDVSAIHSADNKVSIINPDGSMINHFEGEKTKVAEVIISEIERRLIRR